MLAAGGVGSDPPYKKYQPPTITIATVTAIKMYRFVSDMTNTPCSACAYDTTNAIQEFVGFCDKLPLREIPYCPFAGRFSPLGPRGMDVEFSLVAAEQRSYLPL